jgi:hypothetical protein
LLKKRGQFTSKVTLKHHPFEGLLSVRDLLVIYFEKISALPASSDAGLTRVAKIEK